MGTLTDWLIAIGTMGGVIWAVMSFYLDRSEKRDMRLQAAEKKSVLNSVDALADVMKDFKLTQREMQKTVNQLSTSVTTLEIKFAYFVETVEKYCRPTVIDTGDGKVLNPQKVNKQGR